MADTLMEKPAVGRVYLCFRCAHEASRKLGGLPPAERAVLEQRMAALEQELLSVREELIDALNARVVPLSELRELLAGNHVPEFAGAELRGM